MSFTITADSIPARDTWGWAPYWSCTQYRQWHELNVNAYGAQTANQKFIDAWSQLDAFDSNFNWCKYDSDFANYFESYGIDVGHILSHAINSAGDVVDAAGNVVDSANNTTNVLKWLLPMVVIIAAIIALNYAYKKFT